MTARAGLVAGLVAGLWVLADPAVAGACSNDPCWELGRWDSVDAGNPSQVPTDGVFVIDGQRNGADAGDTIPAWTVNVTVDGMAVDGALEGIGLGEVLIWRPAAPLLPGATYSVAIAIDNAMIGEDESGFCGPDLLEQELTFTTGDGPAPPLVAPAYAAEETVSSSELLDLETLVCCDGAYPVVDDLCGFAETYWSDGECAAPTRRGRLRAVWTPLDPEPEGYVGMLLQRLVIDGATKAPTYLGTPSYSDEKTFCGRVEVVSLADGSAATGPEACFGDDLPHPLGVYAVDPAEELGACVGELYTCEVVEGDLGEEWDPEACMPWPGGDSATDSGSTGETETGTEPGSGSETGDTATGDSDSEDSATGGKTSESATAGEDGDDGQGCACAVGSPGGSAGGFLGFFGFFGFLGFFGLFRQRRG